MTITHFAMKLKLKILELSCTFNSREAIIKACGSSDETEDKHFLAKIKIHFDEKANEPMPDPKTREFKEWQSKQLTREREAERMWSSFFDVMRKIFKYKDDPQFKVWYIVSDEKTEEQMESFPGLEPGKWSAAYKTFELREIYAIHTVSGIQSHYAFNIHGPPNQGNF